MANCSATDKRAIARYLCRTDTYFLLFFGLGRKDIEKQWLLERCKEFDSSPNGFIDLWARDHYKSTIITYAGTIREILKSHGNDPLTDREQCIGIFSHTRPISKGFLRQIKYEFETNELLKSLFDDVLYQNPAKESPKWSEDDGITVKRKSNPKEQTIEAWGLVDGQPTGKHFTGLVYDDVVTRESVTTPEMIAKTTSAVELSFNLGSQGKEWRRMIGTRYHFNDTYKPMIERGTFKARIYKATIDGTVDGEPVLLSRELIAQKRRDMGAYTFACQMLQDPKGDETQGFKREWIRHHHSDGEGMNKYMLIDAANGKRQSNDYTAIWIIGLGEDSNYYALDMVRDRLNLTQRGEAVMRMHRKWRPTEVRYERYGLMADIDYLKTVQDQQNYRFDITEVAGQISKSDRIKRLIPLFEQNKFYLPSCLYYTDYEGTAKELTHVFTEEEYLAFPVSVHDDMLDALARIAEPDLTLDWPLGYEEPERYSRYKTKSKRGYMTA